MSNAAVITATITDRTNAPVIRKHLKDALLTWHQSTRQWVHVSPLGAMETRTILEDVKKIKGIEYQIFSSEQWQETLKNS
ncbi:hypothetical protein CIP107539_00920 [Corynebacterium diphtheriae]|uniref:Uncharacterized protein n=1 Tax=Corynebacterium diphtheriae TaxID=1717 RepID=A0A1X4MCN0_CORDP|nr:hypothetical protein [Corynebacterium diphtheriae]OWO45782.1 hypothetical protein AY545_03100 [Corynebacterium belfantii]OSQ23319.1 hypothetical protein B1A51_04990 [Corynebacterium diphtheriae]OWM42251.1 hypothetical protein BU159_03680 [Corynebacterium diphtheriae]OWM61700.1 hypothetical protein BU166_01610 [Corynebacterium diphtheriae]OWM96842.1 hypothetical protein AY481_04095 [Corynebacterium diphtheriae bv. mitis]